MRNRSRGDGPRGSVNMCRGTRYRTLCLGARINGVEQRLPEAAMSRPKGASTEVGIIRIVPYIAMPHSGFVTKIRRR